MPNCDALAARATDGVGRRLARTMTSARQDRTRALVIFSTMESNLHGAVIRRDFEHADLRSLNRLAGDVATDTRHPRLVGRPAGCRWKPRRRPDSAIVPKGAP